MPNQCFEDSIAFGILFKLIKTSQMLKFVLIYLSIYSDSIFKLIKANKK
ncbi:hypothetical protein CKA32_004546 [Geitlerinema sp. FC II]|nr:hypothetical protein CKA32_004546 [Geitlerinema sp. FC II]